MTNNCLITKYKSVIDNSNLNKLGEIRLGVNPGVEAPDNNFIGIALKSGATTFPLVTVIGEGYLLINGNRVKSYRKETVDYQYISLDITTIDTDTQISIVDCDDVIYYRDNMHLGLVYTINPMSIAYFSENARMIQMEEFTGELDIDSGIFRKFTILNELRLRSSNTKGNLSNLSDSVTNLDVCRSRFSINFSELPSNLKIFYLTASNHLSENLYDIHNGFCFFWIGTDMYYEFSWPSTSARQVTMKKFGVSYARFGNDLDNMLVNMAACADNPDMSSENKLINVYGTHTALESVWSAAVNSLKNSGFTVKINDKIQ